MCVFAYNYTLTRAIEIAVISCQNKHQNWIVQRDLHKHILPAQKQSQIPHEQHTTLMNRLNGHFVSLSLIIWIAGRMGDVGQNSDAWSQAFYVINYKCKQH